MSIWIAVVGAVVFVGWLVIDGLIREHRQWSYRGVNLWRLAHELQRDKFRRSIIRNEPCHIGTVGRRCDSCLVRRACLKELADYARGEIGKSLKNLEVSK